MSTTAPKASVIVPVYNTERFLRESLDCLLAQTLPDFEVICVDDGSTDSSPAILAEYADKDERFIVIRQDNAGAGAARNAGLCRARGEYVYFFDSDDRCAPALLEKAVSCAEEKEADIVAFNFKRFYPDGHEEIGVGVHRDWLPDGIDVFNRKICPGRIMNVVNPTPWNKLYRRAFLLEHSLLYEELPTTNDVTFAAVSAACADRIAILDLTLFFYRVGENGTVTSRKQAHIFDAAVAVKSAVDQVAARPFYEEIESAARYFTLEILIASLYRYVRDYACQETRVYYEHLHALFGEDWFAELTRETLDNDRLFNRFCSIRQNDYETWLRLRSRKLIVSVTSYPARINIVGTVLETIYSQTLAPDQVILWLAEEQFPGREQDLPADLLNLITDGRLTLRWCRDLKSHKKYFYAFREYPDDVIVTIDDDLLYDPNLLERLYDMYLLYPGAVSVARAHLMTFENGRVLPYQLWIKETDACIYEPSMQLLATGGSGCLYPPRILKPELLDEELAMNLCPHADDLWLKVMEALCDVPVVVAQKYQGLKYVPGSQTEALCHTNLDRNENDVQLEKAMAWADREFDEDYLLSKFTQTVGTPLLGVGAICRMMAVERNNCRKEVRTINRRLQRAYAEKSEINRKLQITYKEKADRGVRIKELERELQNIRGSHTYRFGFVLLMPLRWLKRKWKNHRKR